MTQEKKQAFKANPSWRRTCSLALTTSAAGKIAKPVFVLREADGGKPGGSRLEEIKKFPFGDSTLGASAVIVTNPTVFFTGPIYAKTVLEDVIHKERIESIGEVACHVDDASTGHTGCKKVKGEVTEKFLPNFVGDTRVLDAKEYKKEVLNMESISIPPGFTSFRPNEQPQINGLLRWKYDEYFSFLSGGSDFRHAQTGVFCEMAISAALLSCAWLDRHREAGQNCRYVLCRFCARKFLQIFES